MPKYSLFFVNRLFQRGEFTRMGYHHVGEGEASGISCVRGNNSTLFRGKCGWSWEGRSYAPRPFSQSTAWFGSLWDSPPHPPPQPPTPAPGREGLLFPRPYLEASHLQKIVRNVEGSFFAVSYPHSVSVFLMSSNTYINMCQKAT